MNQKFTFQGSSTSLHKSRVLSHFFKLIASFVLFLSVFAGCKKDDYDGEVIGLCPVVVATDPMDKAVDVILDKIISATFNSTMAVGTVNNTTFVIKEGTNLITGTIAPVPGDSTFTFTPSVPLSPFTTYTGTITTGATDTLKTAMVADYTWTFITIPQVTVSATPAAGGTVLGAGMFAQGSSVTVSATPNAGFIFSNWTENGNIVSTSTSYLSDMAGNKNLVANFIPIVAGNFGLNLISSPVAGGTTAGSGSYAAGTAVTATASVNPGYTFVNWTDNGAVVSSNSSYPFRLTEHRTLVANFAPIASAQFTVSLSASPTTGGTTTGGGSYNPGASVTITAAPNADFTFLNWTDNGAVASTSASYVFVLSENRTLVANFVPVGPAQVTVSLSSNPALGGTTSGGGSYNPGTPVTAIATAATNYNFVNWTENGSAVSTSASYTFTVSASRTLVANFVLKTFTLTVTAVNGSVTRNPNQTSYNSGTTVQLTPVPNSGFVFTSWTGDATGSDNPLTVTMNANKNITANFTAIPPVGPQAVNLRTAGDFSILSKAGVSTTGITSVAGDIGVSPAAATAITGFGLIMDTNGQSSTTPIVTGKVYASDYAAPTPAKMTTAVSDMETAFTTANGLTTPAPIVGLYGGDISGRILTPGLYKWASGVLITNAGVTLSGGPNDTWVFQISQDLTVNNSAIITLIGGAQAKNIFWVVSGQATLGSNANFSGIILSKTLISLNTGARVTGKLLAQTAITLNASTVVQP